MDKQEESTHSDRVNYVAAKSQLDESRRQRLYERKWLARNHPDIFKAMEAASKLNNERYQKMSVMKMQQGFSMYLKV